MSKPKSVGLSRRGFLASSLGAVTVASIGCGSDDGVESSTEVGSGGSGGTTDGTGSGGAATGGTSPASGGATASTGGTSPASGGATVSTGGTSETGGSAPVTGGTGAGTGGSAAGTGGSAAGTGGSEAGTGGSQAGTGGSDPGTGGSAAGTGGSEAGTGKEHLAAACGTYCGACPSYIARHSEDEQIQRPNPWGDCDGCLAGGMLAGHCQTCEIRLCAASRQNVTRCCDCVELPCYRITNLINLGNYPHRQEYLPNLALISEMGVQEWVRYEEERWRCPQCGLPMLWYDTECARCGEPRSENLFPVTEDTPRPY
jgi:hypothetical protein